MARFVRALDASVTKIDKNAALVAVWLTDEHEKTKAYLPRAHDALKLEHTALTYFPGDKTGPGAWGINSEAFLTAVVAHKGKVAATFGYVSVNETVVPDVEKALKQAIGKKP